jgi:hypothetical protein
MTDLRTRLAHFLCEEHQFRTRMGPFWGDLSIQQKQLWKEDADRYIAHLEERGLKIEIM